MKQSQNNNFDQFVKGKLENASVEAPAFIWNKIERNLPPVLPWYSKYKYLLLLLLLCFTSASSIVTYKHFNSNKAENLASNKIIASTNNDGNGIAADNNLQTDGNATDKNGVVSDKNAGEKLNEVDATKKKNTASV